LNTTRLVILAALGIAAIPISPAASAEAPPGAASCSGCHDAGTEGPLPRLTGRNAAELVAQMQAFRSGQLQATVMDKIAKGFSETEVQAIAAWYAEQQ